jgi:molybdopterin/thiamine biosynthesis adenylyltransferase
LFFLLTYQQGTEALKNLVLPGIGFFSVVHNTTVTLNDCSKNFFVSQDQIGQPMAKVEFKFLSSFFQIGCQRRIE